MTLLNKIKKQRDYWHTVHEIRYLPRDIALDLDIYPGDAERLARRAVWGK